MRHTARQRRSTACDSPRCTFNFEPPSSARALLYDGLLRGRVLCVVRSSSARFSINAPWRRESLLGHYELAEYGGLGYHVRIFYHHGVCR